MGFDYWPMRAFEEKKLWKNHEELDGEFSQRQNIIVRMWKNVN